MLRLRVARELFNLTGSTLCWLSNGMQIAVLMLASSAASAAPLELVLNNPTAPPFTTADHQGLFDVVVGEAFRRNGLRLKLVTLPAERGLINANEGIDDGDLSRIAGIEKNYPNLVRVPERIFEMHFVAFSRGTQVENLSWAKLDHSTVSFIKGWKIFENNLPPGAEITTTDTAEQLMNMLELGRVQYVLYSRWMGLALIRKMHLGGIGVNEPALAKRDMYVYLNKKYSKYIPALARTLRDIKKEGMYSRVCREKFSAIARLTDQCQTHFMINMHPVR